MRAALLFILFFLAHVGAHPNYPGGCSVTDTGGHGTTLKRNADYEYHSATVGNSYLSLSHDGGTDTLVNTRITVTLGSYLGNFKGFIFRTTAGTLTPKTNAANAQYCPGAVGHTESSNKNTAEAYLDLPSTPGTVTVTAEAVMAVNDVYELTVDVHVVAVDTTWTEVKTSLLWSGEPRRYPQDSHTGYSVSMSSDGSRVAIGSSGVNAVRVVDYDEATTTEKEVILPYETGSSWGYGVSLSGDGTLLAIMGDQSYAPTVRKYDASSESWKGLSGTNNADNFYGHDGGSSVYERAVAMSRDGSRVAYVLLFPTNYLILEAFDIDSAGSSISGVVSGHVDISGIVTYTCGTAIAISADGTRVVVGCPSNSAQGYKGEVRVYEITGNTINLIAGIAGDLTAPEGRFGASVAISGDGKRIVIGAPGRVGNEGTSWADTAGSQPYVHIYEESSGSEWVKVGGDVTMPQVVSYPSSPGSFLFAFGMSVAISDDGSVIAIRSASKDSKGGTFLHKLDSATGDWRRIGEEIEDNEVGDFDFTVVGTADRPATPVSLSGDGQYVAIGSPWYSYPDWYYKSGQVRVFKDPNWVDPASAPSPASPASPTPSGSCSSSRATGGTVTTSGEYTIHNFTSSGIFTVTDSSLTEVEVLVVGGGGPGGWSYGGGGGGGAVLYSANEALSSSSITVTVGNGGTAGDDLSLSSSNGGASAFDGMVANGGKTGGRYGSFGGASGSGEVGGSPSSGAGSGSGGGGGGAGGPGEIENNGYTGGGDGGPGVQSDISGPSNYYGGGGGGGNSGAFSGGNGGLGGGGAGHSYAKGISGSAFTGGGGGGGGVQEYGGSGGSGVVIVRYTSPTCNDQSCGTDYYHDGSDCVACPTGSTRLPDTDNECLCPANYHRKVDGGVYSCAACAQGSTRPAGDTVPGGTATTCTESAPSAEDKKKQAETTRDSILDDISDARVKAKAKLLADAAIAGVKVQRLSAKLTAADEDTACSETFSKAGMSAGDGACVATAASSGKRRSLSAMAYDVELMFSASTVNDDALKAAELELKNNGVEGVTSQTSVDPIAELKTVPGVNMGKLQTFETEASAAATAAEAQTPPPPTPPPPPKPNLVLDDDDGTVGLVGKAGLLMASAFTILAM